MRVLHIYADPRLTHGAAMFEYCIAQKLKSDGIYFDYLVSKEILPEDEERYARNGSRVFHIGVDEKLNLLLHEIRANIAYYKFFKTHDYKIVYADTENALRAPHLLMARLAGVPVRVLHSHNTQLQTRSRASRIIARALRHLFRFSVTDYFACSEPAAEWLFPPQVYRRKAYTMLKNGVDMRRFAFNPENRAEIRGRYGVGEGELLLGHVGRFMPQKNHARLVEIFAELKKLRPDARLMLIGEGPLRAQVEALAREKGVLEGVIFVGAVQDVAPYLHAMDVFTLPSLFEGLPVTGVEAQAAGLRCVFSDTITRELQISDLVEFMSLNTEPVAWAKRICALGNAGHADVSAQIRAAGFDIDQTADRLRTFYLEHSEEAAK